MAFVVAAPRGQDRGREGVWAALALNASSFPAEPPDTAGNIIPVYCALLATLVLGLLAYVAFKCWRSHKQRQQLAKARAAELGGLGGLDVDQARGRSVFLDSPSDSSHGPRPELGCRLYLHLPRRQQEEVERLLEAPSEPEPGKGWRGLAGRLGYQAEAVETMAQGQAPAHTLLRDWATQEGSRATLKVLEEALAAMGREDVLQALSPAAQDCPVV